MGKRGIQIPYSQVCEDKEVKLPKLVCEEPVEKEAADVETI